MEDMVYGFQKCVAFVDGMKQHMFKPKRSDLERSIACRKKDMRKKKSYIVVIIIHFVT